jgi:hypothetical protein
MIPRGAKNYFWGTFQLRSKGAVYGINLYDPNWKKNNKNWELGRHTVLFANLFSSSGGKWKHLRRCRLSYYGYTTRRMQIGMELLWLEPHKRQRPIFKIRAFGYEQGQNYAAGAGNEVLVVFPRGLENVYAVQSFQVGYWRASDTLGRDVSYRITDDKGLLQPVTDDSLNDDDNPSLITTYQWKSRRFVKVSSYIRRKH